MVIRVNSDEKLVQEVRAKLKENDGYCPCVLEKTPETRCICESFLNQPEGECHCGLYIKYREVGDNN